MVRESSRSEEESYDRSIFLYSRSGSGTATEAGVGAGRELPWKAN